MSNLKKEFKISVNSIIRQKDNKYQSNRLDACSRGVPLNLQLFSPKNLQRSLKMC